MGLLHEEYTDDDGRTVLFKCMECGNTYLSLGSLHAHVESHWSTLRYFRWHLVTSWLHILGRDVPNKWMESTVVLAVDDVEMVTMDEVDV